MNSAPRGTKMSHATVQNLKKNMLLMRVLRFSS